VIICEKPGMKLKRLLIYPWLDIGNVISVGGLDYQASFL